MKLVSLLALIGCLFFSVTATAAKVASREQAVQLVKSQYQGKVLKVQSNKAAGYQVKMISKQGVVFYLIVNAQTGHISKK